MARMDEVDLLVSVREDRLASRWGGQEIAVVMFLRARRAGMSDRRGGKDRWSAGGAAVEEEGQEPDGRAEFVQDPEEGKRSVV